LEEDKILQADAEIAKFRLRQEALQSKLGKIEKRVTEMKMYEDFLEEVRAENPE
jgi:hypothetical protein